MSMFSKILGFFKRKPKVTKHSAMSYEYFDKDLVFILDGVLIGKDKQTYYRLQCPKYNKQITVKKDLFDFLFKGPKCSDIDKELESSIFNPQSTLPKLKSKNR